MVTWRSLTVDHFLPGACSAGQTQQPPTRDRTPPPPSGHAKKKQRVGDPPSKTPTDAPSNTPPWPTDGIVIQEPTRTPRPTIPAKTNIASSSQIAVAWQPSFMLGGEPLPLTTSLRTWSQGQGGRVAHNLVQGLLFPKDINVLSDSTEDSLARRLQWHIIAVIFPPSLSLVV